MTQNAEVLRIVVWGTYDIGKPRVRIMLRGLKESNAEVILCHRDVWQGIEDKSGIASWRDRFRFLARWLWCYPALIFRYLKLPEHDVVIVGYLGHLDVLVLWPFAKWRGVPVVWEAFLSLYNTVVEDRQIAGPRHPLALILYAWEWLACRAASLVVLDTKAHADYFASRFRLSGEHTADMLVGAETDVFYPRLAVSAESADHEGAITVLFYGQFIPLHGIETIIAAATRLEDEAFEWDLIGQGQEAPAIRAMLERHPLPKLHWTPWVSFHELPDRIRRADVCLGIFGNTLKANLVIPNKAYQILAVGKPLITRESDAMRQLVNEVCTGIFLVPPADPGALANALLEFKKQAQQLGDGPLHRELLREIEPAAIGRCLVRLAGEVVAQHGTRSS